MGIVSTQPINATRTKRTSTQKDANSLHCHSHYAFSLLKCNKQSKPKQFISIEKILGTFKWIMQPKLISNFQIPASMLLFLFKKLSGVCRVTAMQLDFKLSGPLPDHAYQVLVLKI